MTRRCTAKIITLLLAFALVTVYVLPVSAAGDEEVQVPSWYDSISEMLAAGEYEEGVVIAGIDMTKAKRSGDPGSALETGRLKSDTEELIYVDPEDAFEQQEFISWMSELKDKAAAQQNDGVCITSIRRSDMTTARMLKLLASDESIVFAEPNYIISTESQDGVPDENEIGPEAGDPAAETIDPAAKTIGPDVEAAEQAGSEISDENETEPETGDPAAETIGQDDSSAAALRDTESGAGGGTARDASALQWSSSEDTTLHAADKTGSVSMNVPGWPDGSNMDHEIIVAVVDMPVDFSNPDLKDRAYTFSPELKAKLGCDDHGFNAKWDSEDGKLVYDERADHGTHVAGIIGASWDGKGISGAGSEVRIISVQNIGGDGYSSLIDTLRAYSFIKEAVENGVDIRIINNSWGLAQSSKALDAAVTELGRHGVISFFAAGNESQDLNASVDLGGMMADNPYAILVASTTPSGELADTSCYGTGIVTLGAPGTGILSCLPTGNAQYLPSLAENNKFYENFEDAEIGASEPLAVKVCQVGFSTFEDKYGDEYVDPDPDKPIPGTEAVVVSGDSEMGFEGKNVIKVKIDKSDLRYGATGNCALKIDFGDVSDLGISPGDRLGFAFGGKEKVQTLKMFDTASGSEPYVTLFLGSKKDCWNTYSYTLQENIDTGHLTFILELSFDDADEIYLDALGIGNELLPYGFMSGTSMAAPAAAGAAAVLASRHYEELEALSASDSAERLAGIVRSSVRPSDALSNKTSTGGIIDLTVDTGSADPSDRPGPDITDVTVSGSTVILSGTDFGKTPGNAAVFKYTAGNNSDVSSSVIYWSDTAVVLTLGEDFEGVMEASLTAANGKYDTIVKFISRSSSLFEKEHHFGTGTGGPFEFDEPGAQDAPEVMGDYETAGLFVAGNGKLYYMPQMVKVEQNPAYRSMYCYDPDTDSWTVCPAYPCWIRKASAAWLDGRLYVKGTTVYTDESGEIPYYEREGEVEPGEESGTVCIYSYSPGDSSWVECSAKNVATEHTLFAAGSKLMLAGVTAEEWWSTDEFSYPGPRNYDPSGGAGEPLTYLNIFAANPKVVYAGGYVYLCEYEYGNRIRVLDENMSEIEDGLIAFPEFWEGAGAPAEGQKRIVSENDFSLVAYDDMIIFTGPAAKDGSSDTYVLRAGEKSFTPLKRRISDAEVFMPSAAVLDGRLYVIGSSDYEPEQRVFRSTALPKGAPVGATVKAGSGITVKVTSNKSNTVTYVKPEDTGAKTLTVPSTVVVNRKTYKVTAVAAKAFKGTKAATVAVGKNVKTLKENAFRGSKVETVRLKTKLLTKKSVSGSLKGSVVSTVKVYVGDKAENSKYVEKYKKYFTKANAGRKVTVK